jgi:hypothetical protein
METFEALKERYGGRNLAAGGSRQMKKRTLGDDGSRRKLAAARRGMTAIQEWRGVRDVVI